MKFARLPIKMGICIERDSTQFKPDTWQSAELPLCDTRDEYTRRSDNENPVVCVAYVSFSRNDRHPMSSSSPCAHTAHSHILERSVRLIVVAFRG